jgi:hypothetical protein
MNKTNIDIYKAAIIFFLAIFLFQFHLLTKKMSKSYENGRFQFNVSNNLIIDTQTGAIYLYDLKENISVNTDKLVIKKLSDKIAE